VLEKANAQAQTFNAYDRPHDDLREFIARAERAGEIVRIKGADWKLEMGTLGRDREPRPAGAAGAPVRGRAGLSQGHAALSGATNSSKRLAITLGLPVPHARSTWCAPIATA
jgi:4-hydroxy-3-polyprenylbenzoate decarboxylase